MENYIKIKDEFDTTEIKKVGDYWCKSWSQYRGQVYKMNIALSDGLLDEEINKLTLTQLKEIHNCMGADINFKAWYIDFSFIMKRHKKSVEVFNKVVDRIDEISNNIVCVIK